MPCFSPSGRPDYCSPNVFQPQPSRLYHNNRDGTFTDVTAAAGLAREFGPALGVSTADFNGDGWPDIYVANDGQPNQLWINQHDGTFKNMGLLSGTALSAHGKAKAGMGVDAGDFDNDGDEDLFVTNLTGEGNDLYVNDGIGAVRRAERAVGPWPREPCLHGLWHGVVRLRQRRLARHPHRQRRRSDDRGAAARERSVPTSSAKAAVQKPPTTAGSRTSPRAPVRRSSCRRSAAAPRSATSTTTATWTCSSPTTTGEPRLLMNNVGNRNHWIGLRLVSFVRSGRLQPAVRPPEGGHDEQMRDMLGARVQIVLDNGMTLWRRARSDGSYASANDPRVLVGLGQSTHVAKVRVVWPGGTTEEWTNVPVDRYTTLAEGSSK